MTDSITAELKPRIVVFGVGGGGCNATDNMIRFGLKGVVFVASNTDAQALGCSLAETKIQLGVHSTSGLGAGADPAIGRAAAEEQLEEIASCMDKSNMIFVTAGMGGGTGTGAAPVVARAAKDNGSLVVGVVTKPFTFEGTRRMRIAEQGILELQSCVDTLIVIPNQNLFGVIDERTTIAEAFKLADEVLHDGVRGITDLITRPGQVNLDFADVRKVIQGKGKALMGTGEANGDDRAVEAANKAISNPLLGDVSLRGAGSLLINITGGTDIALSELDKAVNRIAEEGGGEAEIIFGSTLDPQMEGKLRVSVVATGIKSQESALGPGSGTAGRNQPAGSSSAAPGTPEYETPPPGWSSGGEEQVRPRPLVEDRFRTRLPRVNPSMMRGQRDD